ncbi:CopG family transcriptional regulator [Bdellovibrionota bacterium FG-1]
MKKKKNSENTTADNLERKFDHGDDVLDYFEDQPTAKRVNLDIPAWAVQIIDGEAHRRGMARQQLIKHWIIDKVDQIKKVG